MLRSSIKVNTISDRAPSAKECENEKSEFYGPISSQQDIHWKYNLPMPNPVSYQQRLDAYTEGKDFLAMQRETITLLVGLLNNVVPAKLSARPAPDKWSVVEIVAHMAEDELTSSWRYRQMLEAPGVTLAGFDQDLWAELGDYSAWEPHEGWEMFRLLREANLRMLAQLSAEQWECFGIHAERGRITVRDLARYMAGHDRNHIDQIRKILGS